MEDKSIDILKEVVEQQRIEEKMFESFAAAEAFFSEQDFLVEKEAAVDLTKLTSLQYLLANTTEAQLKDLQSRPKIQTSWKLTAKV